MSRLEHDKKGQDIALKAIHYIKQKRPGLNISIDFIGTGSSGNYLQQLSKELNVEKQANFLGLQTREYIYENLHTYDLLIQPSIYEGFGLTVVEGMAARIPVLVSNNDGPMEIIRQGKYGFYFEKKHVEDCAQQIMEIIDLDTQQISDSVTAAFNHASQNFDIRQTVRKYLEIYSE